MKPGLRAWLGLPFYFGLAAASFSKEAGRSLEPEAPMSMEERKVMDYRINRIVENEIKNEGRFTAEFCELIEGSGSLERAYLGTWLEKRLRVETRSDEIEYKCCLLNRGGVLKKVKLPAKVPVLHLDDLRSSLSLSPEETRYVEVLLALSISRMPKSCGDGEQLMLMISPNQFSKIAEEKRLTSNGVRILERPAERNLGFVFERCSGKWWNGYISLLRVQSADREKLQGIDLLMALERNLGRWAKRVEGCGAGRGSAGSSTGVSTVTLHLMRKELHQGGYYRLSRTSHLGEKSEITSALGYTSHWDYLTLLRPLGRWLQARVREGERGSFSDAEIDGQDIDQKNVDSPMYYRKRCIRLYDGEEWMVILLVRNDGVDDSFLGNRPLLEETLAGDLA